jgi:hypothetical protein
MTPALHLMLESLARACTEHAPRTVFTVEVERSRIAAAEARTVAAQLLMQVRSPRPRREHACAHRPACRSRLYAPCDRDSAACVGRRVAPTLSVSPQVAPWARAQAMAGDVLLEARLLVRLAQVLTHHLVLLLTHSESFHLSEATANATHADIRAGRGGLREGGGCTAVPSARAGVRALAVGQLVQRGLRSGTHASLPARGARHRRHVARARRVRAQVPERKSRRSSPLGGYETSGGG